MKTFRLNYCNLLKWIEQGLLAALLLHRTPTPLFKQYHISLAASSLFYSLSYRCHFVIWLPSSSFHSLLWRRGWSVFSHLLSVSLRPSHSSVPERCYVLLLVCWLEDLETAHQSLVDAHHCAGVIEFSAIVWRGKECYELSRAEELVSVFDDLMSPAN